MYEHLVERRTVGPTFYRDFPVEVAPLTKAHRDDPRLAERWDLVAFGTEIDRLFRAQRSRGGAGQAHRAVAARRGRRRRGDAAGRGLPARAGVRYATGRRDGRG